MKLVLTYYSDGGEGCGCFLLHVYTFDTFNTKDEWFTWFNSKVKETLQKDRFYMSLNKDEEINLSDILKVNKNLLKKDISLVDYLIAKDFYFNLYTLDEWFETEKILLDK